MIKLKKVKRHLRKGKPVRNYTAKVKDKSKKPDVGENFAGNVISGTNVFSRYV